MEKPGKALTTFKMVVLPDRPVAKKYKGKIFRVMVSSMENSTQKGDNLVVEM